MIEYENYNKESELAKQFAKENSDECHDRIVKIEPLMLQPGDRPEIQYHHGTLSDTYYRMLCVRQSGHGFGYMQSKAKFLMGQMELVEQALRAVGAGDFCLTHQWQDTYRYAGYIVNRRKHHKISDQDMEGYLDLLETMYPLLGMYRRLISGEEITVSEFEIKIARRNSSIKSA